MTGRTKKISPEQANEIREARAGGLTLQAIADAYNVSVPAIWYLCKGIDWRAVKEQKAATAAVALACLVVLALPALAQDAPLTKKEKHAQEREEKERDKAVKRAQRARDWDYEHRIRPMPPAIINGKIE